MDEKQVQGIHRWLRNAIFVTQWKQNTVVYVSTGSVIDAIQNMIKG